MAIKVFLYLNEIDNFGYFVDLSDGVIVPERDCLHIELRFAPPFTFKENNSLKAVTNNRINTTILIGNSESVFYTKLNCFEKARLKWMFGEHHIQKEWKWWVGILLTLTTISLTVLSKWTDIVNLLAH